MATYILDFQKLIYNFKKRFCETLSYLFSLSTIAYFYKENQLGYLRK